MHGTHRSRLVGSVLGGGAVDSISTAVTGTSRFTCTSRWMHHQDLARYLKVAYNDGYRMREVTAILRTVDRNRERLLEAWHEYFDD